jgi:transcriptional repressor NrdR
MRCPFCNHEDDKVVDSRASKDGREIRRRRECEACTRRFTTYERVEESMPMVVKADGRREAFDRNKIERGLRYAIAKRPVTPEQVAAMALELEREVAELGVPEIASRDIGQRVLPRLRELDQVAYVRFASIYLDFRDLDGFARELSALGHVVARSGGGRGRRRASTAGGEFEAEHTVETEVPDSEGAAETPAAAAGGDGT